MKMLVVVCAVVLFVGALVPPVIAQVQQAAPAGFEQPPVLKAGTLVPAALLKGARFQVDEQVPTSDLVAQFTLRSDFGTFRAHGREILRVRVAELGAIERLEATSKSETFLKAAGNAAVRPIESAGNILLNPVETAKGVPGGVSRFYDRMKMGAQHISEAASDPGKSNEEKAAEVSRRVGSVSVDVLGYDDERRALAKRLQVDPYTTNPVLAEKLTDVAWVAFSGRLGVNALVSVAVPGSTALTATSVTNDMVWDTKPADLLKRHAETLAAMGVAEKDIRALLKNPWYSVSILTLFVNGLERLKGVPGRPEAVTLAMTAASEDDARFFTRVVQMLARYHETVEPLGRLVGRGTVIGYNRGGAVVVPAPVDYLSWTQRIGNFARRSDLKTKERTVWLTGKASPRARQEFQALGWSLREDAPAPIP
jgi:hypothetical protein